jgi:SAM-dependent methyltransferase
MEETEYAKHYLFEQNHWWFKGRRWIVFSLLRTFLKGKRQLSVLDAGCGTGLNIKYLEQLGDVIGIDISPYALQYCKKKWDTECRPGINNGHTIP